ncbi:acyltransferase [Rhizobium leguminosarum]|jgi:acetyltransferase-like isoleucine patch superfamily enzyme|uniref:acyltransferase n=1 Tax=Rhizobium leguminosarum TaxID=384 RepID=UPI001C9527EA|nr:acyltransferase [Rhizobium leguminosarum]MBY5789996.1 acyltransferase [Rhizobium leguminosarum]
MQNIARNISARLVGFLYRQVRKAQADAASTVGYSVSANGALLAGCVIDCRSGAADGRVFFGRDSVLSCRIVLERDIGTVHIGNDSYVGGSQIICADHIEIGNNVLISWGCTIVDHDSHSVDWRNRAEDVRKWREGLLSGGLEKASESKDWAVVEKAPIKIGDKTWLGMNVTVLKGITIGEGAVVAAGSVVTKDVDPWTLVAGNPARVIKELPKS